MQNSYLLRWAQPPDLTRRLPVEILAIVFRYWKDSCSSHRHGFCADWVCATWICKRWREIALGTPALWSSVLISQPIADDPVLEVQLDCARGTALDLYVFAPDMTSAEVEDALEFVLARRSPVKNLSIVCSTCHPALEGFTKTVATEVLSLSIHIEQCRWNDDQTRWQFTSDVFPRLRRLALCRIIPIPGAPFLHLTHLELVHALDEAAAPPRAGVHQFLAACPNLEVLRIENGFAYETDDMIEQGGKDVLPVVTLPRLRSLSVDQLGLDIATAVGTLRLPALATFHIDADCAYGREHCTFFIVPQNITEALPPIRRSRCLSLVVGADPDPDMCELSVTMRGSERDPMPPDWEEGDGDGEGEGEGWSITLSGLNDTVCGNPEFFHVDWSCCIRDVCALFLTRIPHLVVPAHLVRLELHVADRLPVARDWARFFAPMLHLQTLAIGSGALIRLVLAAFEKDPGLCPVLEELELCVGRGLGVEEDGLRLAEFIVRALGVWARGRAMPLRSLTVQTSTNAEDSGSDDLDLESASESELGSQSDEEHADGSGSRRDTVSTELAWKLCQDVGLTLKAFVLKVFLLEMDCSACNVEYGLDDRADVVWDDEFPDLYGETYY